MKVYASAGPLAGDKDIAAYIRDTYLRPTLDKGETALLDFVNVELATQSFIHAMIANVVRADPTSLERIEFKNCADEVQAIIEIVVDYAQREYD